MSTSLTPITLTESKRLIALEGVIQKGLSNFIEVGNALAEIKSDKLYRAEFGTFDNYCCQKWGFKRHNALDLIATATAAQNVEEVQQIPTREQARPLTDLDTPEQQQEAWEAATEAAGDEPPTAKQVAAAVEQVKAATPPKPKAEPAAPKPKQSDRYDAALERIGNVCGANIPKLIRSGTLGHIKEKSAIFWASLKDEAMVSLRALVVETSRWTPEHAHRFLAKVPDEKTRILELQSLTIAGGGVTMVTTGYFSTICINTKKRADEYKKVRQILGL